MRLPAKELFADKPTEKQLYACRIIYRALLNQFSLSEKQRHEMNAWLGTLTSVDALQYISDNYKTYVETRRDLYHPRHYGGGWGDYDSYTDDCYDWCVYSAYYG